MSLRLRLALSFALLAGLVAAAVGLVVYQLTQQDLLDRARAKAVSSARDAASFYDRYDVLSPGSVVGPGHGVPVALRRVARHDASPVLHVRELVIDRAGMEVHVAGEPVSLTPTEYRLLIELAEHPGVVCSRERLLEDVWGYIWAGDTRLVDMHVRRLRAKIGADMIETVRGAGYKLVKG